MRQDRTEVGLHTRNSLLRRFFCSVDVCLVSGADLYAGSEIDFTVMLT